ncbi:MAG: hypothetical protein JNG84_12900 [Archangium sp.]|nr:hypothetical protein [Archangium sp.]
MPLTNQSRVPLQVQLSVAAPFSAPSDVTVRSGETVDVEVRFTPEVTGVVEGTLTFDGASISLRGEGVSPLTCTPPSTCTSARFDADSLGCIVEPLADDTACGSAAECVTSGLCRSGQCVGDAARCADDGNACTREVCLVGVGCTSADVSTECVTTADPCLVPVCNPATGCATAPVADGTPCGDVTCTTANLCIEGTCRVVTPPDGFACTPASPCQSPGVCRNQVCDAPPSPTPLTPRWSITPSGTTFRFNGVNDAAGNWYWVECTTSFTRGPGPAHLCTASSRTNAGAPRFSTEVPVGTLGGAVTPQLPWPNTQLLAAGLFVFWAAEGTVAAVDMATGALRWTRDVEPSLHQAEVRALAEDGRGALWVEHVGQTTNAEYWLLTVLDVSTGLVRFARPLNGRASPVVLDDRGNAYVSYDSQPPLHTRDVASYDPLGARRFVVSAPFNWNGAEVFVDGQLLGNSEDGFTALGGAAPHPARATGGLVSGTMVAIDTTSRFFLGRHIGCGTACGSARDSVVAQDATGVQWTTAGSDLLPMPSLFLTQSNDVLFLAYDTRASTPEPFLVPETTLIQRTLAGQTVMQCPLNDAHAMLGFNGRSVAVARSGATSTGPGGSGGRTAMFIDSSGMSVDFYDVGAIGLAAHGWVAPRGMPSGVGRAR